MVGGRTMFAAGTSDVVSLGVRGEVTLGRVVVVVGDR